jgi:hypothetical protein
MTEEIRENFWMQTFTEVLRQQNHGNAHDPIVEANKALAALDEKFKK